MASHAGPWTRALSSQDLSVEERLIIRFPLACVLAHVMAQTEGPQSWREDALSSEQTTVLISSAEPKKRKK